MLANQLVKKLSKYSSPAMQLKEMFLLLESAHCTISCYQKSTELHMRKVPFQCLSRGTLQNLNNPIYDGIRNTDLFQATSLLAKHELVVALSVGHFEDATFLGTMR